MSDHRFTKPTSSKQTADGRSDPELSSLLQWVGERDGLGVPIDGSFGVDVTVFVYFHKDEEETCFKWL
jgi:hypothetical protein